MTHVDLEDSQRTRATAPELSSSENVSQEQTDYQNTRPSHRYRKALRRLVLAIVVGIALTPLLLSALAAFLIRGQDELNATVAFPFGGQLAYERTAEAIGDTVEYAGVFNSEPNRLVQRGLVPSQRENMLKEYERLGIANDAIWTSPPDVVGLSNLLDALENKIEYDPEFTCAFLINCYHSRHFTALIEDRVSPTASRSLHVVTCDPYSFSIWNWWLDSHGRRTVITEGINLLAFYLAERTEIHSWRPRTSEEIRDAAVDVDG